MVEEEEEEEAEEAGLLCLCNGSCTLQVELRC